MKHYVPLDIHSSYSIGKSICTIPHLVRKARELGLPALALTDDGFLFGAKEFYNECRRLGGSYGDLPPIKPVIGLSIGLSASFHWPPWHRPNPASRSILPRGTGAIDRPRPRRSHRSPIVHPYRLPPSALHRSAHRHDSMRLSQYSGRFRAIGHAFSKSGVGMITICKVNTEASG